MLVSLVDPMLPFDGWHLLPLPCPSAPRVPPPPANQSVCRPLRSYRSPQSLVATSSLILCLCNPDILFSYYHTLYFPFYQRPKFLLPRGTHDTIISFLILNLSHLFLQPGALIASDFITEISFCHMYSSSQNIFCRIIL